MKNPDKKGRGDAPLGLPPPLGERGGLPPSINKRISEQRRKKDFSRAYLLRSLQIATIFGRLYK
jgi:hypothetical protein